MTRLASDQEEDGDSRLRTAIRKEVRQEFQASARRKKWKSCWGCFLFLVAGSILLLGGSGWILAQSGLKRLPLFSQWSRPPEPTRFLVIQSIDLEKVFEDQIKKAIQSAASGKIPASFLITIREEELTGFLGQTLIQLKPPEWVINHLQIVLESGKVELFADLARQGWSIRILARGKLDLIDGQPRFSFEEVRLGRLPLPSGLINLALNQWQQTKIPKAAVIWEKEFGRLETLTVKSGLLEIGLATRGN